MAPHVYKAVSPTVSDHIGGDIFRWLPTRMEDSPEWLWPASPRSPGSLSVACDIHPLHRSLHSPSRLRSPASPVAMSPVSTQALCMCMRVRGASARGEALCRQPVHCAAQQARKCRRRGTSPVGTLVPCLHRDKVVPLDGATNPTLPVSVSVFLSTSLQVWLHMHAAFIAHSHLFTCMCERQWRRVLCEKGCTFSAGHHT